MKNLLYLSIFLLISFGTAIAQDNVPNHKYVIGGNLNIARYTYNNPNVITLPTRFLNTANYDNRFFSAAFHIGRKVSKNGIAGTIGLFEYTTNRTFLYSLNLEPTIENYKSITLGFGIFYRRLFNLDYGFQLYTQPSLLISKYKSTNGSSVLYLHGKDRKNNSMDIRINFGIRYNVSSRWNILVNIWDINYQNKKETRERTKREETRLDFSFDIRNISLGGEFLF